MVRVDIQKPAWERTKRQGSPMRKNFDTRQTWKINKIAPYVILLKVLN